jgi:hypothetical protein
MKRKKTQATLATRRRLHHWSSGRSPHRDTQEKKRKRRGSRAISKLMPETMTPHGGVSTAG